MWPQATASGRAAPEIDGAVSAVPPLTRAHPPWWIWATLAAVLAVYVPCLVNALAWVDRPFSGFLFLENGIVVSIGRMEWAQSQRRRTGWTRVLAIDDQP